MVLFDIVPKLCLHSFLKIWFWFKRVSLQSLFRILSFLYITVQSDWKNYRNFLGLTTKLAKFFVFYTMKNRPVPTNSIFIILNFNIQNQFPPPKTQLVTQTELAQSCCLQDQQMLVYKRTRKGIWIEPLLVLWEKDNLQGLWVSKSGPW